MQVQFSIPNADTVGKPYIAEVSFFDADRAKPRYGKFVPDGLWQSNGGRLEIEADQGAIIAIGWHENGVDVGFPTYHVLIETGKLQPLKDLQHAKEVKARNDDYKRQLAMNAARTPEPPAGPFIVQSKYDGGDGIWMRWTLADAEILAQGLLLDEMEELRVGDNRECATRLEGLLKDGDLKGALHYYREITGDVIQVIDISADTGGEVLFDL